MKSITCKQCKKTFKHNQEGMPPLRCKECRKKDVIYPLRISDNLFQLIVAASKKHQLASKAAIMREALAIGLNVLLKQVGK